MKTVDTNRAATVKKRRPAAVAAALAVPFAGLALIAVAPQMVGAAPATSAMACRGVVQLACGPTGPVYGPELILNSRGGTDCEIKAEGYKNGELIYLRLLTAAECKGSETLLPDADTVWLNGKNSSGQAMEPVQLSGVQNDEAICVVSDPGGVSYANKSLKGGACTAS